MRLGLPSSLSRNGLLIVAQFALNLSLAIWLYIEYLHNPFMQAYMSSLWSTISAWVTITAGVAIGIVASLVAYNRGRLTRIVGSTTPQGYTEGVGTSENLSPIDVCPYCDKRLKIISEGRLQCRNCRRYFKSSLPKVPA